MCVYVELEDKLFHMLKLQLKLDFVSFSGHYKEMSIVM